MYHPDSKHLFFARVLMHILSNSFAVLSRARVPERLAGHGDMYSRGPGQLFLWAVTWKSDREEVRISEIALFALAKPLKSRLL